MCEEAPGVLVTPDLREHVVGRVVGREPGPTLIVMTLIHGNEPAGHRAARALLERIHSERLPLCGELIVLQGNLQACQRQVRYIDDDLNRHWSPSKVAALQQEDSGRSREDGERRELIAVLSRLVQQSRGPLYFLDLHTSSADGAPFLTVGDTLRNREFAMRFPLPLMLGLEEQVDGSLLEYLNNYGFVTLGVEAGGHDAPQSVAHHQAVLWVALTAAGLVARDDNPRLEQSRLLLRGAAAGVPPVMEVRYRKAIDHTSRFRMEPGFVNFQPVRKGQLLAHDHEEPLHAPEDGCVLLPLYQGIGDDGFFIAREVRPLWLRVSARLRRAGLATWLRRLPGIRPHPELEDVLVVNTRIARLFPLQLFHLAGYRKLRWIKAALLVAKRQHDLRPPPQIRFP